MFEKNWDIPKVAYVSGHRDWNSMRRYTHLRNEGDPWQRAPSGSIAAMNTAAALPMDPRRQSKFLYWMGWRVCEIAEATGENAKTLRSWKNRDGWDRADSVERIGGVLEARLMQLILKPAETAGDFKEIGLLHRQLERQARIRRYQGGVRKRT